MRDISVIFATALVTATITILSMNAISSTTSKRMSNATRAPASVDVMQMMKDAKELPNQNYDAY
jgi:UDP-N-acetylglucosamine enolpyruvyl transferase